MKQKVIIYVALFFFLLLNTSFFLKGSVGLYTDLFLLVLFIVLFVLFIAQLAYAKNEHFQSKQRVITVVLLLVVVGSAAYKPSGLINYETLMGNDVLVAGREGSANCTTMLRLKENGKFTVLIVCFGVFRYSGRYLMKGDSVFFNGAKHRERFTYEFGILNSLDSQISDKGSLKLFRTGDTVGYQMFIVKSEINSVRRAKH